MVRIDCLIFGYRKIKIPKDAVAKVTTRFLHMGVSVKISSDGEFTVRERDREKAHTALSGIEYTESECLGLLGAYKKIKNKPLVFSAVAVCMLFSSLSSCVVWDVRIDGNERITDAQIALELEGAGLSVGAPWWQLDRSKIEATLLRNSSEISWVNINRRGSVAYVSVAEKHTTDGDKSVVPSGYANVVARADCVIEEITVKRGVATVKQGDTVKKGDVLISGVLPAEAGGGFCYAEGCVIGRMSDTIGVTVERSYVKKSEKSKKIASVDLKIFNFSANIFKSYGNSDTECDIIKEIKTFSLFGKALLPLEISIDYATEYSKEACEYTDSEMVSVASARLTMLTDLALTHADLLKIRTSGHFTDTGYVMSNELVFTADVSSTLEFASE
ncbi:MAG: sporulation protein YqfD [Clostridia bacterium]|nr:sporulation protein YqfD [Clostridia bacterium]